MSDPDHYTRLNPQPIDVINAWDLGWNLSNVLKYVARCNHKGEKEGDLLKAIRYIRFELDELRTQSSQPALSKGVVWDCETCEGGGIVNGPGEVIRGCPRCQGSRMEPNG